jgi:hypothetical protein
VGSSAGGIVRGNILSFTTPRPPSAYTFQYELTANYSNVVNGFLWPYGNSTLAWFEYGTDSTFTTFAQTAKRSVGSGTERVTVAETLPGLQNYTRYYLRIVGSSVGGTATGNVAWFSTGGPPEIVSSGFFPSASCDAANLFAFATPNGAETGGWFEVGATSSMSDYTATPAQSLGAATARPVSFRATLPMGATFYFRAVVRNWLGTERDVVNVVGPDLCVK